jgi:3-methylfumaryl-CoA hydratase
VIPVIVERSEFLVPGPAEALAGLLGAAAPQLAPGEPLPLLWHWLYLLDRPARVDQGADGHPLVGVPSPPGPGFRRMFAGGRVRRFAPLHLGREATRRTWVADRAVKQGRTGRLEFVTVRTEMRQDDVLVISEEQDIVYREAGTAVTRAPAHSSSGPAVDGWSVDVDPVLLFRFSALTYNGHRIHYDREYARDVEGYPSLVVHGPLQAMLMAELARRTAAVPDRCQFSYRLVAPLFEGDGLTVSIALGKSGLTTEVRNGNGGRTATGTLR